MQGFDVIKPFSSSPLLRWNKLGCFILGKFFRQVSLLFIALTLTVQHRKAPVLLANIRLAFNNLPRLNTLAYFSKALGKKWL